jgi:A/G-specific adenine glycosylase
MSFEKDLITWYEAHRRHMAWREDPTPYHVYLSEIMLQQTQVDTVRAYYDRFLIRFPTIQDLASAPEDEVLKLWEGLGYYSRGRNLHKAAQVIVRDFGGNLPEKKSDLLSLPGIGEYTSRAIRSIAFHQKEIAVDGNLIRVYARLCEDSEEFGDKIKGFCESYFLKQLQNEDPSHFNQALMDLGEMVCLPKGLPLCESCPLKAYCRSKADGTMLSYPLSKKAKEKRQEEWTVLVVSSDEEIALIKRPDSGLLASLYQFPMLEGRLTPEQVSKRLKEMGLAFTSLENLGVTQHVFSHLVWDLQGYHVILTSKPNEPSFIWAKKKELKSTYPIPSAFRYYQKKIL